MNSNNKIWGTLLKVSLGLILVLSFLQVKMKFGWDPLDRCCLHPDSIPIETITLSDSVMNIEANNTQNLLAQIEPANATNQNLKWSSSDTTVAIVDSTTGRVTATGKGGECIITAAATDDSGKSANIKIKVNKDILVDTIISPNSNGEITLNPDSEFKIETKVLPENAANKSLAWKSDNESVATVNNGVVTGKADGYCTITAYSVDGGDVRKSIKVRVQEPVDPIIEVTSIILDKSNISMNAGERFKVRATISPKNASNKILKWQSSNPAIATVNDGIIVGVKRGDCAITAYSTDGSNKSALLKIHVNDIVIVTSIVLDKQTVTLDEGKDIQLKAKVSPSNASNKVVRWQSSNSTIATVNNGKISARKPGDCVITASTTDGSSVSVSIRVHVSPKPFPDRLEGNSTEEKIKYGLSFLSNSNNKIENKIGVAEHMSMLFDNNSEVIIQGRNFNQIKDNGKDYIKSLSTNSLKLTYINHKVNSNGLITELIIKQE